MKIITEETLIKLIKIHGLKNFFVDLVEMLKHDFGRWHEFNIIPRPAMHVRDGVLELMPICDDLFYSYKYVNCHPNNFENGLMTVVATGQLARVDNGYPLMFSEMTLLTALRTAATTAIATDYLARKNSHILAIIGTGAQSEFLVNGISIVREIEEVRYFDIDPKAMDKFENNFRSNKFKLTRCANSAEAVNGADIITTCTACRAYVDVLKNDWIKPGVHINGIGGDSKGKTELEISILSRANVVVEYFNQCIIEGEIQRLSKEEAKKLVKAELFELINGTKTGRDDESQITLYDAVGIALEDYSVLKLTYNIAKQNNLGDEFNFTPSLVDPKNLISMLN